MMKKPFCLLMLIIMVQVVNGHHNPSILEIRGRVVDNVTNKPIPQCNIYLKSAHLGTVTNNVGEFVLKVPNHYQEGIIVASRMDYNSLEIPIIEISTAETVISLQISPIMIGEVLVQDAEKILVAALNRVRSNYPNERLSMTSFYREVVKKNRKYVDVSQGVINISKGPYEKKFMDALNIVKGSRTENYSKGDTLAFKVMGGPNIMLLLDVVKNPGLVMDREILQSYNYTLNGIKLIDDRRSYVITFSPRQSSDFPLYSGVIYIDEGTLAISGLEFGYDDSNLKLAASRLIKQSPAFVQVKPTTIRYEVKYRETNGLWYLDYVRNEIDMKCKWKRRLFNSRFSAVSEMVVIEKHSEEIQLNENTQRISNRFSDRWDGSADKNFWEDYSIIKPEEDLMKALVKIDRKKRIK